ncbi:MAG: hypothetical protein NVSMB29_15140 [Candidatus Dormibacteria bacterium]
MPALREIALVSDDLIFASRLGQVLGARGGRVARAPQGVVPAGAEAVFVDLNQRTEERIAQIVALRAERPAGTIVGFCHHAEHEVRRRAMAAGADQVLTNGGLQAGALRVTGLSAGPVDG